MKKIIFKLTKIFSLLIVVVCLLSIQNIVVFSQDSTDSTDSKVYLPIIQRSNYTPPESNTPTGLPSYTSKLSSIKVSSDDFFVTTNGSANGDGSMNKPWDLDSALLGHSEVRPGDIIWVRGGTYHPVKELSKYNIKLSGNEENPIVIRAYPGERVTIEAGIQIYNPNVVFWGFEIFSSDPDRESNESGSHPGDIDRSGGIAVYSDNVALINNIIHDAEYGINAQISIGNFYTENAVIYGNLSFNNGWIGPDRGHGYGLYGQNEYGTKYIYENIMFNNFGGYSYHIYRENGPLKNFIFFGNIAMNGNFLVGGLKPTSNIGFEENYTFNATTKFGFSDNGGNDSVSVEGNHFWSTDSRALDIKLWKNVRVFQNYFYSTDSLATLQDSSNLNNYDWNENSYYSTKPAPFTFISDKPWQAWRNSTGFDSKSNYNEKLPTNTNVIVRPNAFEPKRGNIIIQNWSKLGTVSVNISNLGLEMGDKYTIHNAQNFYEETIEGTYDGNPINIPMNGWTVAEPIGWYEPLGENTFPSFGTFVLITNP